MRVLMMFGFAAMWIVTAWAAPLTDTMVPLPMGEVTVRQVWEGILETDAQVVAALASTAPFDGPAALPADHTSQIPLDMALDAMAESLGLIWYHDPAGLVFLYPGPAEAYPMVRDSIPRDAVTRMSSLLDLLEALPTDEERAHLLHGDWLQARSPDDAFGRAVRRMVRQSGEEPTLEPGSTTPLAAQLSVYCPALHMLDDGKTAPVGVLVPDPSRLSGRPRLRAEASSRDDGPTILTPAARERAACPPMLDLPDPPMGFWALPRFGSPEVAAGDWLPVVEVVSAAPMALEHAAKLCSTTPESITVSELLASRGVLVSARDTDGHGLIDALLSVAEAEVRAFEDTDVVFIGPSSVARAPDSGAAYGVLNRGLATVARRVLATGWATNAALCDGIWPLTTLRPVSELSADGEAVLAAVRHVEGEADIQGVLSQPDALVGLRIQIELRIGRPAQRLTLGGSADELVVDRADSLFLCGIGPLSESTTGALPRQPNE